jgi:hypothetical protein
MRIAAMSTETWMLCTQFRRILRVSSPDLIANLGEGEPPGRQHKERCQWQRQDEAKERKSIWGWRFQFYTKE